MKKKTFLLFSLVTAMCLTALGQQDAFHPLLQDGKTWVTMDGNNVFSYCLIGDTLIDDITWKKAFMDFRNKQNVNPYGYVYYAAVREEDEKVFVKYKNIDIQELLYDFGLKVGDRVLWKVTAKDNEYYYSITEQNIDVWSAMELMEIDTINVHGQQLRRFIFKSNWVDKARSISRTTSFSYPTLVWVEGIGSQGGLFHPWNMHSSESRVQCLLNDSIIFEHEDFHVAGTSVSNSVFAPVDKHCFYDLQGRPVDGTQCGILIRNGRKMLVK